MLPENITDDTTSSKNQPNKILAVITPGKGRDIVEWRYVCYVVLHVISQPLTSLSFLSGFLIPASAPQLVMVVMIGTILSCPVANWK